MIQLPNEHDFDPWGDCLDAQHAWREFGGLTVEQARMKFLDNPIHYQEDFMFMGGRAFAFYFSVIEEYLHSVPAEYDGDDRQAWILAHCIAHQFEADNVAHVLPLKPQVESLARSVLDGLKRYSNNDNERDRIREAWTELLATIEKFD